jgi:hemerythrin-like domain-containing protein
MTLLILLDPNQVPFMGLLVELEKKIDHPFDAHVAGENSIRPFPIHRSIPMRPSDILSGEHRVIEQVLNCLEKIADSCRRDGKLDGQSAREAIDFFRNFADRCHHGKEETHFFPAMEAKGFSREMGPTGVMLREHDQGRAYIRGMSESVEAAEAGETAACANYVQNAHGYLDLLREHIQKEDHCLFGMANQTFNEKDQQRLLDAFAHVEAEEMGADTHEKYLHLANELADRWNVPRAQAPVPCHHACGCGH